MNSALVAHPAQHLPSGEMQAQDPASSVLIDISRLTLKRKAHKASDQTTLLENVSFQVRSGEIVALLGRSGAGKTSLLNTIAGFLPADTGRVALPARNGSRAGYAYMFQEDRLLPWRTAAGNVALALERQGIPRAERRIHAINALQAVGLADAADQFPSQLSGGMRSRVALARALAVEAPLLLLDEPFSKLDPDTREEMHELLRTLQQRFGFGALMVTHDIDEALALAQRAFVLSPGRAGILELTLNRHDPASAQQLRYALSNGNLGSVASSTPSPF